MRQPLLDVSGLKISALVPDSASKVGVVLMHGYAMEPSDLSPFGSSLRLPVPFFFPCGPLPGAQRGRAWWSVDEEARAARAASGGGDLANVYPQGLESARSLLTAAVRSLCTQFGMDQVVLGGFSQGGMLACDTLLRTDLPVRALVLLSASRIALSDWISGRHRLRDIPVFVSHGTEDKDLAFNAGEQLREFVQDCGADVTWVPFEGGHEIPLPVWRALRRFLLPIL